MEKIDAKMREFDAVIIANGEYPTAVPEKSERNRFDYKISEGKKP